MGAVNMSDKTLQMTMLFDFFGDLLTDKQREYFDLYYNEDLSLSEIADNVGITRQGVHDTIIKAEAALSEYERKTGIVARFSQRNADIENAEAIARRLAVCPADERRQLTDDLIRTLEALKG